MPKLQLLATPHADDVNDAQSCDADDSEGAYSNYDCDDPNDAQSCDADDSKDIVCPTGFSAGLVLSLVGEGGELQPVQLPGRCVAEHRSPHKPATNTFSHQLRQPST